MRDLAPLRRDRGRDHRGPRRRAPLRQGRRGARCSLPRRGGDGSPPPQSQSLEATETALDGFGAARRPHRRRGTTPASTRSRRRPQRCGRGSSGRWRGRGSKRPCRWRRSCGVVHVTAEREATDAEVALAAPGFATRIVSREFRTAGLVQRQVRQRSRSTSVVVTNVAEARAAPTPVEFAFPAQTIEPTPSVTLITPSPDRTVVAPDLDVVGRARGPVKDGTLALDFTAPPSSLQRPASAFRNPRCGPRLRCRRSFRSDRG